MWKGQNQAVILSSDFAAYLTITSSHFCSEYDLGMSLPDLQEPPSLCEHWITQTLNVTFKTQLKCEALLTPQQRYLHPTLCS